jgi:PAS domain S-box-containing protein
MDYGRSVGATHLPAFVVERRAGLLDFWAVYEQHLARFPDTSVEAALRHPEFGPVLRSESTGQLIQQALRARRLLRSAIVDDDWQPYIDETRAIGARCAELGVGFAGLHAVVRVFQQRFAPALVDAYAATPARLSAALAAMVDFLDFALSIIAEQYADTRHRDHTEAERRNLEDRFRALAAATPDAIVTADHRGRITYVNHATEALFGRSTHELVGEPLTTLMPERLRGQHRAGLARFLATREPRLIGRTIEMPALVAGGSEIAIEMSITTWDARGEPQFAAIIRDISERKRIEATLEERTRQLEERTLQLEDANRELEAFSFSVAHDLRAPLRAMGGFSKVLLEDHRGELGADVLGYFTKIGTNVRRMSDLIDALLGLSRLSRGELQRKPVDLTRLARSVIAQLAAAEPHRVVDATVEDGLAGIADARLVRTVLENLIGNAWKFTSKLPSAEIAVGSIDGRTFYVRDNGAGFDLVQAGKLFSPFERLHTADEFPGTGIGLTTVQRIVHRHGGKIWVQAKVDNGATFFFTLAPD